MDYDKDFEDGFEYTSMGALHFMHHPGTKEKIIFLHGMGANTKVWSKLVQFLPDGLDVFLIDLLGHGKSDAPEMDYTVSNQFQALREFIAAQNNGNSFIFGHSYGGWIAAYYASQPYTCKGIILEDYCRAEGDVRLHTESWRAGIQGQHAQIAARHEQQQGLCFQKPA